MKTEKKERAIDNISYQEDKKEKQKNNGLQVADVSDKMTIPQIREYIRRYQTGESTSKYLEKFKLLKPELEELQKLAEKRTS